MRPLPILISLLLFSLPGFCQFYLRGELKNDKGEGLQGARIYLLSKGNYPYYSGSSGTFGIPINKRTDSITVIMEGYDSLKTVVSATQFNSFTLKSLARKSTTNTLYLSSLTKNLPVSGSIYYDQDGETYSSTVENQFIETATYPETGFALHTDKASYSNIRRFLNNKEKPPTDAVRIEEMLNYFNFESNSISHESGKTFQYYSHLTSCPWNAKNKLLYINCKAKKINLDNTPPANLVFLIDASGSMDMPNRLPLIKSAFKLLTENLREKDVVSIVTYGDRVTVLLPATTGDNKEKIVSAIEGLVADGGTAGASAIRTAYTVARGNFMPNGNNRIILATDGDFNIGQTSDKELEDLISQESKTGVYLTCLGVGMGNYKDSKLEGLAKRGNGNFAYLDNEKEAEKVLTEEFSQTLYSVANDVFLNITFDPAYMQAYRLIGFDNRKRALTEQHIEMEGGEIGSGHSFLACFEVVPNTAAPINKDGTHSIAKAGLTFNLPDSPTKLKEVFEITDRFVPLNTDDDTYRFATAVIMFGTLLKQSSFGDAYSWEQVANLATSAVNPGNLLQKEMITLIEKAKKLYGKKKAKEE